MLHFTEQEYEYLSTVEDRLYAACYLKFVRLASKKEAEELDKIYQRVFKTKSGIIGGCSHCVYTACKKLGTLYFEDKKEKEAQNNAIEEAPEPKQEKAPEQPQKTATTKTNAPKTKKTNKKK